MSNIPTAHNECADKDKIAKVVLMPGDPLRAKHIAELFLTDVECFTTVRNILGYTGFYNGKRVSVMGSGMGMPSIGIYSYELYAFYDVDTIIRVGSAGSYDESLKVYDTVIVKDCYSDSTYAKTAFNYTSKILKPDTKTKTALVSAANRLNIKVKECRVYSSDVFYSPIRNWHDYRDKNKCLAVEMESFALFANAKFLGKKAACILTISDSLVTGAETTAMERERLLNNMIKISLETL